MSNTPETELRFTLYFFFAGVYTPMVHFGQHSGYNDPFNTTEQSYARIG